LFSRKCFLKNVTAAGVDQVNDLHFLIKKKKTENFNWGLAVCTIKY